MPVFTLREYLSGKVAFRVGDAAMASVLADRGVQDGAAYASVPVRTRELCLADLYAWYASGGQTCSSEDSHGVWRHKESVSVGEPERRRMMSMANAIYSRYGERTVGGGIRIVNGGVRWTR